MYPKKKNLNALSEMVMVLGGRISEVLLEQQGVHVFDWICIYLCFICTVFMWIILHNNYHVEKGEAKRVIGWF